MEIVKSVFQSKSKRYQFIRYCTVGTLAAGIHYGVYYLLQEYEMTNLNIAYTIGYVTSFICNFFLTSYFTFRSNPSLKRALGFGGSHLVNYLIHMGLFNLFLYLHINQLQDINYELRVTSYKGASQVTFSLSTCSL